MSIRISADYGTRFRKRKILGAISFFLMLCAIGIGAYFLISKIPFPISDTSQKLVLDAWNSGDYRNVYDMTIDQASGTNAFWSIMNGFSAYYLGEAQIISKDINFYNDQAIFKLRRSLLFKPDDMVERIYYALGKAYYTKGSYYGDLSVFFLNKAKELNYNPVDIHEYLGLAYASIGDYRNSVIAFTSGLGQNPSDLLLLAISRSYLKLNEPNSAKPYLYRCINNSKDVTLVIQARLLAAEMLKMTGDTNASKEQYISILALDENNATAHFELGELYSETGDIVKARAEWRKALKIDPTHHSARARLNI